MCRLFIRRVFRRRVGLTIVWLCAANIYELDVKEEAMKKIYCAMKAAVGVKGVSQCHGWRWVLYHNI